MFYQEFSVISLAIMVYEHYTMLNKYGKWARNFFFFLGGGGYFYFNLVFYILGAFLVKQLFHSCWIWDGYSQLGATRLRWLSTISYPTRARGIIVNISINQARGQYWERDIVPRSWQYGQLFFMFQLNKERWPFLCLYFPSKYENIELILSLLYMKQNNNLDQAIGLFDF